MSILVGGMPLSEVNMRFRAEPKLAEVKRIARFAGQSIGPLSIVGCPNAAEIWQFRAGRDACIYALAANIAWLLKKR